MFFRSIDSASRPGLLFFHGMLFALLIAGCQPESPSTKAPAEASVPRRVVVTSFPLLEMTRSIAPDDVDVVNAVPEGKSSLEWTPSSANVQVLQKATVILISGAGHEPWRDRVSLPSSRMKDTASGYYEQFIRIPDAVSHQHGPQGQHSHPGTVWATWLDPNLAVSQLSQITDALVRIAPESKSLIETESAKLGAQLESLNSIIEELATLPAMAECTLVADGPYYQYLTRRLRVNLTYLHWPVSGVPSEDDLQELASTLEKLRTAPKKIFVHSVKQSDAVKDQLASAGFRTVQIDICELADDTSVSFVERMRGNLTRLKDALISQ